MKNIIITFFAFFVLPFVVHPQEVDECNYWLSLQGGGGMGFYREMGASPLTYRGPELLPAISLTTERGAWRNDWHVGGSAGGYGLRWGMNSMQAYGGQVEVKGSVLNKIQEMGSLSILVGGNVEGVFDVRYHSGLGNSATSFSNWIRINGLIQTDFQWRNSVFYFQFGFNPLALVLRPGYAFMDNFDQDIANPIGNTFDQYRWYVAGFFGMDTELGYRYQLKNGNKIGVSYRWRYITSRISELAPHRFEYAQHGIVLDLMFKI